jgi:diketogulonate reductase-like aldo/keto reductase
MPKRKLGITSTMNDDGNNNNNHATLPSPPISSSSSFRETSAAAATCLTDGVRLTTPHDPTLNIVMPWIGFGTYKLGKQIAETAVTQAIVEAGYRAIDTAFIYGGETTEAAVGQAIQQALVQKGAEQSNGISSRDDIFVTTKHWRKYHGYEATQKCLGLSLKRLQLQYIDLWLMHWPGPAWNTMTRNKEVVQQDPWHYAATSKNAQEMADQRAETWRAMEDACRQGLVRAIGVSNMTVQHLKKLKERATLWPPAVNQVEFHPLYPQTELLEYCKQEGIVVQAYASLGGQDTGKAAWNQLLGDGKRVATAKKDKRDLLHAQAVIEMASQVNATPAQLLLRWGLERGCAIIPKTASKERMLENADVFKFRLTKDQVDELQEDLISKVKENNPEESTNGSVASLTRLCWRSDPFRHLDFE